MTCATPPHTLHAHVYHTDVTHSRAYAYACTLHMHTCTTQLCYTYYTRECAHTHYTRMHVSHSCDMCLHAHTHTTCTHTSHRDMTRTIPVHTRTHPHAHIIHRCDTCATPVRTHTGHIHASHRDMTRVYICAYTRIHTRGTHRCDTYYTCEDTGTLHTHTRVTQI